jgi:hypothetical protein
MAESSLATQTDGNGVRLHNEGGRSGEGEGGDAAIFMEQATSATER